MDLVRGVGGCAKEGCGVLGGIHSSREDDVGGLKVRFSA